MFDDAIQWFPMRAPTLKPLPPMLFHTWPFLVFLLVVLPVFFALRKTRLWLPWLTLASYFFYGWWNPYYLFLVLYATVLDFSLVALMDHCPRQGQKVDVLGRLTRLRFDDPVLKRAFLGSVAAGLGIIALAVAGPHTLRPAMAGLGLIVLLMGLGSLYSSRRTWLAISLVNNLALLLFFSTRVLWWRTPTSFWPGCTFRSRCGNRPR